MLSPWLYTESSIFLVFKEKRVSKVKKLVTDNERVQEIVRMVGGSDEVLNQKSQLYQFALKLIK
jgi:DNA repair ATPase RecN